MKKLILLTSFLCFLNVTYGQKNKTDTTLSSLAKIDLGLQGIGFTYEARISNHLTTDLSAGIGGGYNIAEGSIEYELLKPALYVSVTPKYFYNLDKRLARGKTLLYNSGNYIGARFTFNTPVGEKTDIIRNSFLANIHWGIQRAIGGHWLFNSHIGVGYAQDIDYNFGTIYPALDLKFSYVF